jgi:hypothetical protein
MATIDYMGVRTPWSFEADHYFSVETHPHLAFEFSNLRAIHRRCNRQKGTKSAESVVKQQEWVIPDW